MSAAHGSGDADFRFLPDGGDETAASLAIRDRIEAEAKAAAAARLQEIAALCQLAGAPRRAATFIERGASPSEVRDTLLAERFEAGQVGGEISGSRPMHHDALPQHLGGAGLSPAGVAARWDRVGTRLFGDRWKGFG